MGTIILRGADFSANNIGKVDITIPFSYNTVAILERYGAVIDETNSFQRQVNKFVVNLTNANIIGSETSPLKILNLPFLSKISKSGDLAFAQINALNGVNAFTNNIAGSVTLTNNGLKVVQGANLVSLKTGTLGLDTDSVSLGIYNNSDEPKESSTGVEGGRPFYKFYLGSCALMFGIVDRAGDWSSQTSSIWRTGSEYLDNDVNYVYKKALRIANFRGANYDYYLNGQKTSRVISSYVKSNFTNNVPFGAYNMTTYVDVLNDVTKGYLKSSASVFFAGKSLTDIQATILNSSVIDLMNAANAFLV